MDQKIREGKKSFLYGISIHDYSDNPNEWSLRNNIVFIIGILFRIGFFTLGLHDHEDNSGYAKFTDLDYFVFTDGAQYVLNGGSPYQRITYRYTPIFAYIVIPNHIVHPMFGKLLFCILDFSVILLIRKILHTQIPYKYWVRYQNLLDLATAINPFVFILSVRGSNDVVVGFVVLMCLYLLIKRYYVIAGALYGLSVHLKIYPIIYGFPLILFIDRQRGKANRMSVLLNPLNWFTPRKLKFFGTSAVVFFSLLILFYKLYGYEFLYESYIYHTLRVDHRHNFSFNFYFEYLHYDELPDVKYLVRKLGFVAQWGLVSFVGIRLCYDLTSAIAIQTFVFVIFNRVITAQYFLWFSIFLPFIIIKWKHLLSLTKCLTVFFIYFAAEMWVNFSALPLEILGKNTFEYLFFFTHMFHVVGSIFAVLMISKTDFTDTLFEGEADENIYPEQYTVKVKLDTKLKTD